MGAPPGALTEPREAGAVAGHAFAGLRVAARWAVGYLAVSAIVLGASGHVAMVAVHIGLVLLLFAVRHARHGIAMYVADFLPLAVVIGLAYGEVPTLVAALGMSYHDSLIEGWETNLFRGQPSRTFAGAFPNLPFSELVHAGYMSFYLALSLPLVALYARRERAGFTETSVALIATWIVCCALFAVFPVQGPRFLWGSPDSVPLGPFRQLSMLILANGSARGTAFPSLHMAASLGQAWMAWRWQPRWVAVLMTVSSMLVAVGAVYAGYHYAVDMIAGAVLGLTVTAAVVVALRTKRRLAA